MPQKRMECSRLLFDHLALIKHQVLSGIRDSRKEGSLWGMMRGVWGVRKSIHQSWLAKGLGIGLLCWGFKGVQERFRRKRPALFKSGQWHFHQDNASVHYSILVKDYLTKMGIKTVLHPPYSPDLAPCDFWSFPKLIVVMRQLRIWKRLWRRTLTRSRKRTSMEPFRSFWNSTINSLELEEITSKGTRVSCVYYQQKCRYEKKSGKLFNDPRSWDRPDYLEELWRFEETWCHSHSSESLPANTVPKDSQEVK